MAKYIRNTNYLDVSSEYTVPEEHQAWLNDIHAQLGPYSRVPIRWLNVGTRNDEHGHLPALYLANPPDPTLFLVATAETFAKSPDDACAEMLTPILAHLTDSTSETVLTCTQFLVDAKACIAHYKTSGILKTDILFVAGDQHYKNMLNTRLGESYIRLPFLNAEVDAQRYDFRIDVPDTLLDANAWNMLDLEVLLREMPIFENKNNLSEDELTQAYAGIVRRLMHHILEHHVKLDENQAMIVLLHIWSSQQWDLEDLWIAYNGEHAMKRWANTFIAIATHDPNRMVHRDTPIAHLYQNLLPPERIRWDALQQCAYQHFLQYTRNQPHHSEERFLASMLQQGLYRAYGCTQPLLPIRILSALQYETPWHMHGKLPYAERSYVNEWLMYMNTEKYMYLNPTQEIAKQCYKDAQHLPDPTAWLYVLSMIGVPIADQMDPQMWPQERIKHIDSVCNTLTARLCRIHFDQELLLACNPNAQKNTIERLHAAYQTLDMPFTMENILQTLESQYTIAHALDLEPGMHAQL